MKKKITLCTVLSTFIICAMLCLTNCSNNDAPTPVLTPEALEQTTWQVQKTEYNIKGDIVYTGKSILQFITDSEGIETVDRKIITFCKKDSTWTVLEYTGTHLVMEAYNPNRMVWTLEKMY